MNEDLMVKRNHRTRRVWKTTYTCPNIITYICTHKNKQQNKTQKTRELENHYRQNFAKSTQSSICLKTLELEAATTVLGKAFQISRTQFEKKYLCVLTREQPLNSL